LRLIRMMARLFVERFGSDVAKVAELVAVEAR
jgi:hypothetical protein